jgi:Lecithin retinol acyltransferase
MPGSRSGGVQLGTLAAFAAGQPVTGGPYAHADNPDVIIERAMSRLGDGDYNLVFNNCRHFARWCVTGEHVSDQVNAGTARAGAVLAPAIGMPVGIALVGSAGLATGLSGPGIMSGLARCGSIIGGGAVGGLLLLGLVTGGATLIAMNPELRDDRFLPENERAAHTAGRIGSGVGLAAGSAGTVFAVSTLGTSGLSGAGITSGLAALGSVLGGGMKAGTKCAIAIQPHRDHLRLRRL